MALDNDATLIVSGGFYYRAPTGTAFPADLDDVDAPWVNLGHTSLEDILSISSEGGEPTVLGTLQNKQLRTTRTPRTETFSFVLQQFDEDALKLFFGSNATTGVDGTLQVPTNPTPTTAAFLAVFQDSGNRFAIYAPRAEIFRGEDMELSDTESFAGLPLAVTPLVHGSNTWTYAVLPLEGSGGE